MDIDTTTSSQKTNPHFLEALGLSSEREAALRKRLGPGQRISRVTGVRKGLFLVRDENGESLIPAAGRLHHHATADAGFPLTGDWVIRDSGRILSVLPRKNVLARGASGNRGRMAQGAVSGQEIAANLDTVFIVCGLDRDFNLRRIERYLTLVYNCGCQPVVLLSKADLHPDVTESVEEVESIAFGVPVHAISATSGLGMEALSPYLEPGRTVALLGSSGVGKSTLLNALAGEDIQKTRDVSLAVGKGVHTTTTRDLIVLPLGGLLIDNPGIREIAFWDQEGTSSAFPDIVRLAEGCRFADCTHGGEPGCRVREACENGELDSGRLESYLKQRRELLYLSEREEKSADRVEKERWKWVAQEARRMKKRGKMKR